MTISVLYEKIPIETKLLKKLFHYITIVLEP